MVAKLAAGCTRNRPRKVRTGWTGLVGYARRTRMAERTIQLERGGRRGASIRVRGRPFAPHKDLYHFVLAASWPAFFAIVFALYVSVNLVFAAAYRIEPDCIGGVHGFEAAFYFSVQTMATIGYGTFAPATRYGHVLVTFEAIVGVFATAMVTGLTFAKFARPSARVVFADKIVIFPRDGVPHLMFRLANARHNSVVEAQLRVTLLVTERTREGETLRRQIDVPLVRPMTGLFALSWTAMHRIVEGSPFYGEAAIASLREKDAELLLSMSGLDDTIGQTIHARHRYEMDDLRVDAKFRDVVTIGPDGTRVVDYAGFHEVDPIENGR